MKYSSRGFFAPCVSTIFLLTCACAAFADTYTPSSVESTPVIGKCHVEMKQNVRASHCSATFVGGLCSGPDYVDVTFNTPFTAPPQVIVTPYHVSSQGGCVGNATDLVVCYPSAITATGFRLFCSGSPQGGSCEAYDGWRTYAAGSYMAIDNDPSCGVVSQHRIKPTTCEGQFQGGLCHGPYTKHINFADTGKTFTHTPHVLVSPEWTSDQGGCVEYATDAISCFPKNITATGFDLSCNGSPALSTCGAYSGWSSYADGGWLARADEAETGCHVESGHGIVTSDCTGTLAASGVCSSAFRKDITFDKPFTTVPNVIVTPEHVSEGPNCAGGATDTLVCYAEHVTTTGFQVRCAGSPVLGECGASPEEAWYTHARIGYLAMEPHC